MPVASDGILDYAAADALEFCVEAAHYHNADTIYAVKVIVVPTSFTMSSTCLPAYLYLNDNTYPAAAVSSSLSRPSPCMR